MLPFARPRVEMSLKGHRSKGALAIHICKGPFGCEGDNDGDDHCHSFPAIAA